MRIYILFLFFLLSSFAYKAYGQCTGTPIISFSLTNTVNVSCFNGNDGEIEVTLDGGEAPFSYFLVIDLGGSEIPIAEVIGTTDQTVTFTNLFSNTAIGPYRVNVITSNGVISGPIAVCALRQVSGIDITQPAELSANGTVTNECTVNDGEILLNIAGGNPGYSIIWSGPTAIPDDDTNPTGLQPGSYDASITDTKGCTLDTTLVVGSAPDATLSASGATNICTGTTTTVQVAINNGAIPYTVVIDTTGAGTNRTINNYISGTDIVVGPTSTNTYSLVSVVDNIGCVATLSGSVLITVDPLPTIDAGSNEEVCAGSTFDLSTSGTLPNGTNYSSLQWSASGDGSFNNNTLLTPIYTPGPTDIINGSTILTLQANSNCAPITDGMTLTITPAPTVSAGSDETICVGDSYDFNGSGTAPSASNFSSLLWSTSGDGSFDDATLLTPVYTPGAADMASGSATLTLQASGNGSCLPVTDDMILTITPTPTVSAGSDEAACNGFPFDLSTSGTIPSATNFASLLWSTTGDGTFDLAAQLTPVYTPGPTDVMNGTVTLTLQANGTGSCLPITDDMVLTINPLPTASAGSDEAICIGDAFNLNTSSTVPSASNFISLLWSTSGDGSFNNSALLTPIYTPGPTDITNGIMTLTLQANGIGSCLPVTDDMTLLITPAPTAGAGSNEEICSGDVFDFSTSGTAPSATNFISLQWSTSGDGSFDDATLLTPIYTPGAVDITNGVVTLTLQANGNCVPVTDDMTLTITPPPTATAGSDEAVCSVDVFDLSTSGTIPSATNYSSLLWSTSGNGSFDDATSLTPSYTPGVADIAGGTVVLTLQANGNGSCANATDDMTLTITPAPTANAGSDEGFCFGDIIDLSASGTVPSATNFSSLLWSTSGGGSFDDATSLTPIYTPGAIDIISGTVTLTLQANGNGTCLPVTDDMIIIITPAPTIDAGSDETICEGVVFDLSTISALPSGTNYSSLLWSTSGDGSFDDTALLTPIYTPGATDLTNGTVTLTLQANGNGACLPVTDDLTLTFTPAPTSVAGSDEIICFVDVMDLSTSGTIPSATNFSSLLWSTSGDGIFNDNTILTPIYTPGATDITNGSVILTLQANGNGTCTPITDDMNLTITPDPTVSAGSDEVGCSVDAFDLSTSGTIPNATNFSSLLWSTSGDGSFNSTSSLTPIYTYGPTDITNGSVTLTLQANAFGSCASVTDDMIITITPAPTVGAGSDEVVCVGDALDLSASGTIPSATNFSSLLWSTSGDGGFDDATALAPIYTPGATDDTNGTVTLTLQANGNGTCSPVTDDMILTIAPVPTADAGSDEAVCDGDVFDLSTSVSVPSATNFSSLQWSTSGDGIFDDLTSLTPIYTPGATDITNGTVTLTLQANGNASCAPVTDFMVLSINPLPVVTIVPAGPFCENQGIVTLVGIPAGGIWSGTGIVDVNAGTFDPATASIGSNTIGYIYSDINGCSNSTTADIVVNTIPAPLTITGNASPNCQASEIYSVAFTAGSTYAWTTPLNATITPPADSNVVEINFAFADGDITVIETNVNGCSGAQATLGVLLQGCPFQADFASDVSVVCVNNPVTFTDASAAPPGVTYAWDFGVDASPATDITSGPIIVSYSSPGLKTVSLTIDDGVQNSTETKVDYIEVRPLPTAILSGDAGICVGSSAVLTFDLTGTGPWNIVYTDGVTDFPETALSTPHLVSVSPVVNTTYSMQSIDDALCTGTESGTATITIEPPKDVTIRLDSISGLPGSQVAVPLRVIDFEDMMTMQFTIAWDANLLTYNNVSGVTIGNVSASSFGTTQVNNGFLTFSWNTASWSDTTIVDSTAIFAINFDVANTLCPDASATIDESPTAITVIELADENACIANATIKGGNVEIISTASITSDDADNLICFGDQVMFSGLPGGLTNYEFYLNGVQVQTGGNSVYINSALVDQDSVNVIVRDAQGCTLSAQGIITTVNQISVTPTVTDISGCGLSDGAISLVVAGGSGTYTFAWIGPSISDPSLKDQSGLGRGFYAVTVTDDVSGCTEVLNIELKEPASFTLSETKVDVTTTGGSDGSIDLTISGGTGPFNVSWAGPNGFTSSNEDITGLFAGTYTGTITDTGEGCIDAINVEILQPLNVLVLNATKTDVSTCGANDGTINLLITGGSGSYGISWIGPNSFTSTSQNLSGLEGGVYMATVVDLITSLTAQWTVQIDEPEGFTLNATVTDITYCAGADGTITLNVMNGSGNFSYAWRDLDGLGFSSTTKDVTDLARADYRVVVTDSGTGCIDSLDAAVVRPAICDLPCSLNASISTNATTCPDSLRGSATAFVISGGSGFGNYFISLDTGQTYMAFDGDFATAVSDLGKGSHLFKVKDTVTSCTQDLIANVAVSSILSAQISLEDAGCDGGDGKIFINVTGLSPLEVKLINRDGTEYIQTGASLFAFENLDSGAYYYEIREDINTNEGCSILASDSIRLVNDCQTTGCSSLTANAHSFEDATCGSDPDGKAIVDVTGGSSPYEYSTDGSNWIPFISGNVIDQLPPNGIYNIVVRQDTLNVNCRAEVSVEINGPNPLTLDVPIYSTQAASCNQNDGAVKIGRVAGGVNPYNYQIDGSFLALPADSIVTDLGAGIHTFSVIDDAGCTENFPFEVESPGVIIASITDVPVSCTSLFLKAGIRIEVDLDSTTLPGPYEAYVALTSDPDGGTNYAIPDNGLRTILNLDKDFYSIVVNSGAIEGCTYSETIAVFSGAYPLDFDIIDSDSIVSCIGDYGSITIGNVIGDPDTTYIVQLISESNVILETYQLNKFELEGGFTIDESNTDELIAGRYYIKMIQNQSECAGVEAISELINIYEPLGELGLKDLRDEVSLADRPTGYIIGEIIPSGGDPYEGIIQLLEPVFEMNITDIIYFNEQRKWEEIPSIGDNLNRYPVRFDSLWPGLYEMRVRDEYGCEFTIEHSLGYDSAVFIPNVFTPNNDGYNDSFYIRNLPESGTKVVISNRNGFVIFKSDDYNYDTLWDGGTVADGIYYYNIGMPSGEIYKGWVEKWSGTRP